MIDLAGVQVILFDLDNTLYEYAPCHEAGLEAAHQAMNKESRIPSAAFLDLHDLVRKRLARQLKGQAASHERSLFFKGLVGEFLCLNPAQGAGHGTHPSLTLLLYQAYWESFLKTMRPAPEAHAVLGQLASTHRLALVSNHTTLVQLKKVVALKIDPYFSAIVTSEEAGAEKPDGRIFSHALSALDSSPNQALMVGDDLHADYHGARAAGLQAVLCTQFLSAVDSESKIQTIARLGELTG